MLYCLMVLACFSYLFLFLDPLPAPNLTLGYSVEKVNDGFQVTLNCSAPDSDLMRTFYFIETSDKHSEKNVTDYSASLKWELGRISHGTFYCEYEEEIQERKIRSRRSQALTIPLAGNILIHVCRSDITFASVPKYIFFLIYFIYIKQKTGP